MPPTSHSPHRFRRLVILGTAAGLFGSLGLLSLGTAHAALPGAGETVMTSVDRSSPPAAGNAGAGQSSVSADGRYVAFSSTSGNLVAVGNHATSQIYKRDLLTGTTELISGTAVGADSGDKSSTDPSISADGRFVAFTSRATNLTLPAGLTNAFSQVYVRDTTGGLTRMLSLTPGLVGGGNENSNTPSISADGSLIAFQSGANNLVAGLAPTTYQVYVAKIAADPMVRLASARNGTANGVPDGGSVQPAISGDGSTVVFVSSSTDLTSVSGGGSVQVYARSLSGSTTRLLTLDRSNPLIAGNNSSADPAVSFDGSRVAYSSKASNIVAQSLGSATQILVFDRATGQSSLVSVALGSGNGASGESKQPSISADGQKVAFPSTPGNLSGTPSNGFEQVFLRDLAASTTTMVSVSPGTPTSGCREDCFDAALSADGKSIAFTSNSVGLSATPATGGFLQTYLRSLVVNDPTPTATPTSTPSTTDVPATPSVTPGAVLGGQGGSSNTGGRLASTGMSQAPIVAAGLSAAVFALVGASIVYGSRLARRRRIASSAVDSVDE